MNRGNQAVSSLSWTKVCLAGLNIASRLAYLQKLSSSTSMKGKRSKTKSPGGKVEKKKTLRPPLWKFAAKAEWGGQGDFTMDCRALMCEGGNQLLLFSLKWEMYSINFLPAQRVALPLIQGPAAAPAGLSLPINRRSCLKLGPHSWVFGLYSQKYKQQVCVAITVIALVPTKYRTSD